jgi:hypothetical protein
MDEAIIKNKVDEFAKWMKLAEDAKKQIDEFKAEFQKMALELMKDKKTKQVEFWGTKNAKVVVTTTETLKMVSYNFLLQVIGETLINDFVKVDIQHKLSDPFKRTLIAIFQGDYGEQFIKDVIAQITDDEQTRKALNKKLRGNNWEKDVQNLKAIAGLNQNDAEHYAWFIKEAKSFGDIVHLLEAAGHERGSAAFQDALENLRHAVIVEEGIKVGLESEGVA